MRRLPTGVTVITQGGPDTVECMTANSLVSVSLDPLLIAVSVRQDSRMRARLDGEAPFAVHVLSADQRNTASLFARHDRPSGREAANLLGATASADGNTIVPGAVAAFECMPYAAHPAGDHVLFLGSVTTVHLSREERPPLLFHNGSYLSLRPDSSDDALVPADAFKN
ncbi:flavin reductase family protein [Planomonospora algeriensis]